jgi:hypothetical protein
MGGHATTRPQGQAPPAEKTQASRPTTMTMAATSRAMSTVFLSLYRRVALNPTLRPYSSSLRMSSSMLTSLKVTTRTRATKRAGRYMSHTQASCRVMSK